MVRVARVFADDWFLLRDVRLGALADSPEAFAATLEEAELADEAAWREWPASQPVFLACVGDEAVGMGGIFTGEDPAVHRLVALWVDPARRGAGIATALMGAIEDWARHDGADVLELWVAEGNAPARRLYESRGYLPTGQTKPLPSNPHEREARYTLALG